LTGGLKINLFLQKNNQLSGVKFMTLRLKVPNIACAACVDTVTKAVKSIDATANVEADTKTKMVSIETQHSEAKIRQAIADVGYPAA
jgi:copper chaperone